MQVYQTLGDVRRYLIMRVRHLIELKKTLHSQTIWSSSDMPPRHAPVYSKTKPMRAGWKWRSAKAEARGIIFILVAECNSARDNWKSMLIVETSNGASVVGRFESHGSHPGLHAHAHCLRSGFENGGSSIDNLIRIPNARSPHRRTNAWTENTFWDAARRFFRLKEDEGPLFRNAA